MASNGFIRLDDSQIRELESLFSGILPRELTRAQRTALSRTRRGAKQRVSTLIHKRGEQRYNLPARRIKEDIVVTTLKKQSFFVLGKKKPVSLIDYSKTNRIDGGGVSAAVIKGERFKMWTAFIRPGVGSGKQLVFSRFSSDGQHMGRRTMKRGRYKGKRREVIRAVTGPSVADMMNRNNAEADLADFLQDRFDGELKGAITYALLKRRRR